MATDPEPDVSDDPTGTAGTADDEVGTTRDPDEDMKAKFREALAHKKSSRANQASGHEDRSASPHGPEQGHSHRMFRRKSGG